MTRMLYSSRIALLLLRVTFVKSLWTRLTIHSSLFTLVAQRCTMTSSGRIGGLEWSARLLSSWMNMMSAEEWRQNTNDQLVSSNLLPFQNGSLTTLRWISWLDFQSPSVAMMQSLLSSTNSLKWLIFFLSKNLSQQLSWQSYIPPGLSPCTAFHSWSLHTVAASLPPSFGILFRRPWAPTSSSAQFSILKLAVKLSVSIRFSKICSGLALSPSVWSRKIVFQMPSSPTTTASKRVRARPHLKFSMAGSVVLLWTGQKLVNVNLLEMTWS